MKSILLVGILFISLNVHSQSKEWAHYYILKIQQKHSLGCNDDIAYKTVIFPHEVRSDTKSKIVEAYKKKLITNDKTRVRVTAYMITPGDYVVIYEVTNQNTTCKYKQIRTFTTKEKDKIPELLEKKLDNAFTSEQYRSHRILAVVQPLKPEKPGLLQQINKAILRFLEDVGEDELKEEYQKATGGTRG